MERIKQLFVSHKSENKAKHKRQISSPVEGSFQRLSPKSGPMPACSPRQAYSSDPHGDHATITFVPQDRGRKETIAWLNEGTSESLTALSIEQERAAKQIQIGPRTKGTREVQQILNEPSRETVERLHHVRQEAEIELLYGIPGVVIYNFSKSWGWNCASRMTSLQLRDPKVRVLAGPYSPINWLVLPGQTRSMSPISELGGWRDTKQVDDLKLDPTHVTPSDEEGKGGALGDEDHDENEGEYDPYNTIDVPSTPSESIAVAIKVIPVCSQHIRQVSLDAS